MPQIINTNIASLNAQRNLNESQRGQETALQRLSSGLRLNSAKDDAAGLAISTRFDAQVRGTTVAARNAGDAISLAQTAEGALDSINNSLQRIRELALQSANDTNTAVDRLALQEEVSQLVDEIKTVADTANFNGKKLLDGSFQNAVFQTGANVGDTITVSISQMDAASLGASQESGVSSGGTVSTSTLSGTSTLDLNAGDLVINGVAVGATVASDDTASFVKSASSAIAKVAAINEVNDQSGVTAVVNQNVLQGTTTADSTAADVTITVNGVTVNLSKATGLSVEANLTAAVTAINEKQGQTGVRAEFSGIASTGISLTAEDGRNIVLGGTAANAAATFGLQTIGTSVSAASLVVAYVGTYTLISDDGSDIAITTDTGNIDNAGFEVGNFQGGVPQSIGDNVDVSADLANGDIVINGIAVGATRDSDDTASSANSSESAIAKAVAINRVADQTNVTAIVNENRLNSGNLAIQSSYSVTINGTSIAISLSSSSDTVADQLNTAINAINNQVGITGVRAEALDSDSLTLIADDGRNIAIGTTAASVIGAQNLGLSTTQFVNASSISLVSGGSIELSSNTGNIDNAGFSIGSYGNGETGTAIEAIDISSVEGALNAIRAVDNAINTVASRRADLGAVQNRFENTISNLEITRENLTSANSRIKDADFAAETAALSRAQVLQQAGISVLAQANSSPQQVLSLLQ